MYYPLKLIYSLVTFAASLGCLPLFLLHPRGRRRIRERYGLWGLEAGEVLWFHGASVGEVAGLLPIMARCRTKFPSAKILLTATSPTGLEKAAGAVDYVRLLPFDNRIWLAMALRNVTPRILVFGETEVWPNLLSLLSCRGVPLLLVNGRISEFSLRYYRWLKPLLRGALAKLAAIYTLNAKYRERFIEFGVPPEKVIVSGNAKYQSKPGVADREEAARLRQQFFAGEAPVLVLGSLRPGEERVWFPALAAADGQRIRTIVAPRHQEKTAYFIERLKEFELQFQPRSAQKSPALTPIVLLDTLGELEKVYSFADLAFIGGTLVTGIGGHNPLEAAAYGVPVALGPHCENIDDIALMLENEGALFRVVEPRDAERLIASVAVRDPQLDAAGRQALRVWQQCSGAAELIVERIAALL